MMMTVVAPMASTAPVAVTRARPSNRKPRLATRVHATSDDDAKVDTTEKFTNAGAFKALDTLGGGLNATTGSKSPFGGGASIGAASDPFAMGAGAASTSTPVTPAGFLAAGVDRASLPPKGDADRLLNRFDRDQRAGTLADDSTNDGSPQCTHPPLRAAARALASMSSRVMMGICAPDADEGLVALKAWTADLGLPKGKLHGLDVDGVRQEPPSGPVFIKYNSDSGDAFLSGYGGDYRGVLFTPELGDGAFRQYGYLPLNLPKGGEC